MTINSEVNFLIKESIETGSTIQEALDKAKLALNAPEEVEVKIEVLEQPKEKKLFGLIGGSLAKVRAYYEIEEDKFAKVKTYLTTILTSLGVNDAEITTEVEDEDLHINISCSDDYGSVIGRRGETLDAIQYLARLVVNRQHDSFKHVSVNVGNYREKRETTLRALAEKNAEKVKKYGRNVVLEPMNPYERRIIHTTIQTIEGVTSHSVGSDENRKVVITLEEGFKATSGRYGNKGKGGYNRSHSQRSNESASESVPARAPKSDTEGVALYGKIEINN